jgi:hypothetical protein
MTTSEKQELPEMAQMTPAKRRRNRILAVVLVVFAVTMYVSIFVRLSVNPLAYGQ